MENQPQVRVGILIVSDRRAAGQPDEAGPRLSERIRQILPGAEVHRTIVADEVDAVTRPIVNWSADGFDLVLTSGGTGLGPRDITPEVTRRLLDRPAPGFVVAMIMAGLRETPHAMLARPEAGIRGATLVVNLPGSPSGAVQSLNAIAPALPHALRVLAAATGEPVDHAPDGRHDARGR